ncbi:choice-of-anchor P family protein [Streptomyces sp. B6B3]|uniref:choice-of-anchor P family protein n=1 Tax=Streptomyces sp. B6B3 TaxID=3153570 RepID=UPI00325EFD04
MINMMLMQRAALAAVLAGGALAAVPGAAQAAPEQNNVQQRQSGLKAYESGYSIARGLYAEFGADTSQTVIQSETLAVHPDGPEEDRLDTVEVGTAGTATGVGAYASGDENAGQTEADAGVAELDLDLAVAAITSGEVRAACAAVPGMMPSGSTSITDAVLSVPGMLDVRFDEAPKPGTVIPLPNDLGQIILNEQHVQPNDSLTVNAMHIMLDEAAGEHAGQIIVGSVNCAPGEEDDTSGADPMRDSMRDAGRDSMRDSSVRRNLRDAPGSGISGGDGDDTGDDTGDDAGDDTGELTNDAAGAATSPYRVCVTEPDDREAGDDSC